MVDDPVYGMVEVLPDGGLKVPTQSGGYAIVYRTPITTNDVLLIGEQAPATVLHRYTENTVAPSAAEIASNPFLQGISGR